MSAMEWAHYDAWADRLQAALDRAYPHTLWLVLDRTDINRLPPEDGVPRWFRLIAMSQDGARHLKADVPFTLLAYEGAFPLVVAAMGRELERRLAAMVKDE